MNRMRLSTMVSMPVFALAVLSSQGASSAQESWQPARGGASSWGSGPAQSSTSVAGNSVFGRDGDWNAGKGSFGSAKQPGGVWTAVPALPATNKSVLAPVAAGSVPLRQAPKPSGPHATPPAGSTAAPRSNAQVSQAHTSWKPPIALHFGMANGNRGGAYHSSSAKSASLGSQGRASSNNRTTTSPAIVKPKRTSQSGNPLGGPNSAGEPAPGATPEIGEPLQ